MKDTYSELNFSDDFVKWVQSESYESSKLEISCAHSCLVAWQNLSENHLSILVLSQGCFSFTFKQFQGQLRD